MTISRRRFRPAIILARVILHTLLLAIPARSAHAQFPRHEFWVPNVWPQAMAIANGSIYMGGSFTQVGPATGGFVGFDMASGYAVQAIPEVTGIVRAAINDGAGGWYIGGGFTSVHGTPRKNLAQIDAAGNVTSWNPGADGTVQCLVRDPASGVVYVGGDFTTVGGQARRSAAAIDASGLLKPWNPQILGGYVAAFALYGQTLYAGGNFSSAAGVTRNNAAAFDASTAALLPWDPEPDAPVLAIATFLSNSIPSTLTVYLGGHFQNVGGVARLRLAAVDETTGALTSWNPGASGSVFAIALAGGTNPLTNPLRIYVGGNFQLISTSPRNRIAQINQAGVVAAWNPNAADQTVYSIRPAGNIVYVGGDFTSIGGQPFRNLAAIDATGSVMPWDPLVGGRVFALGTSETAVFAGGEFFTAGGVRRNRLAALNLATGQATGWNPDASNYVLALKVRDGVAYVGGEFQSVGGATRNRLAALDAVTGAALPWNPGADGTVHTLDFGNGVVYVAGDFFTIGSQSRSWLAAVDLATGLAAPWNPAPNMRVGILHVDGGVVYAGGEFTSIGGLPRYRLAALDAAAGGATAWNPNPGQGPAGNPVIDAIATRGSNVYIAGSFGSMGGRQREGFAVVDNVAGMANYWDHYVSDEVFGLAVDGSSVYIGGGFVTVDNEPRTGIAVLDGTTGLLTPYTLPFWGAVSGVEVDAGAIYLAGGFDNVHQSFIVLSKMVTAVDPEPAPVPLSSAVRATPNPFRNDVSLALSMPHPGNLEVTVYDVSGRVVRRLAHGPQNAGAHRVHWDGRDEAGHPVASGIYLTRAESTGMRVTTKVLKVQ